jgi:hypothetical protein
VILQNSLPALASLPVGTSWDAALDAAVGRSTPLE